SRAALFFPTHRPPPRSSLFPYTTLFRSLDHDLDKGPVDHVHLFFAVAVGEVHFLSADDAPLIGQIRRDGPVQGDVGEGRLGAPAAGGVDAVDKALDAVLDLVVVQVIGLDEGGQVGVEAGEGLGAGPFVLHNAQEVDHL